MVRALRSGGTTAVCCYRRLQELSLKPTLSSSLHVLPPLPGLGVLSFSALSSSDGDADTRCTRGRSFVGLLVEFVDTKGAGG